MVTYREGAVSFTWGWKVTLELRFVKRQTDGCESETVSVSKRGGPRNSRWRKECEESQQESA